MPILRILLAEGRPLLLAGLRVLVRAEPDMEIVAEGEAGNACCLAVEHRPDVVLLGIPESVTAGVQAIEHIRRDLPSTKILAIVLRHNVSLSLELLHAGVSDLVTIGANAGQLAHAIRTATQAEPCSQTDGSHGPSVGVGSDGVNQDRLILSEREEEVLRLVARGYNNRQTADRLGLSPK